MNYRYFKVAEGNGVPRYSTILSGRIEFIGALRTAEGLQWTGAIVPIPVSEFAQYAREYQRAITDGALTEVSEAEYLEHADEQELASALDATKTTADTATDGEVN